MTLRRPTTAEIDQQRIEHFRVISDADLAPYVVSAANNVIGREGHATAQRIARQITWRNFSSDRFRLAGASIVCPLAIGRVMETMVQNVATERAGEETRYRWRVVETVTLEEVPLSLKAGAA